MAFLTFNGESGPKELAGSHQNKTQPLFLWRRIVRRTKFKLLQCLTRERYGKILRIKCTFPRGLLRGQHLHLPSNEL
jgi:hypothetical protein